MIKFMIAVNTEIVSSRTAAYAKLIFKGIEKSFSNTFKNIIALFSSVKFIYKGESGLKLNLAGTFTNWDPWIYQLEEIQPGLYELELPLTTGTYYYNYYLGLTPILDNTNPEKIYTADGRSASVLTVN